MKISHMSCTEILIISLTVTSCIGLITYFHDTRTSGQQAYEAQKQVLTERANALTGTPGGANESINMFIGGIFKTTVTNQQFRVRTGWTFQGTGTYARFSAFKI